MVALSLAHFHYRRGLPLSIRSALFPLIGQKIYGTWGHLVDFSSIWDSVWRGYIARLGSYAIRYRAVTDVWHTI